MSNPTFTIADRKIGFDYEPLVIAEIGINHGGDLDVARHMVDIAAAAGAEIIKHQTHVIEDEMTDDAKKVIPGNTDISIWDVMNNCRLTLDEEKQLMDYTRKKGMIYLSTPFSRAAAEWLETQNVPAYKIGSGEMDNLPLVRHLCRYKKPLIISTGMHSLESVARTVAVVREAGVPLALLHCNSIYPTPADKSRLGVIQTFQDAFPDVVIGYSDHSLGNLMCYGAVALGASIVEKHFTDTLERPGPDIICSMDGPMMKDLIESSRALASARGGEKTRLAEEEVTYRFARASVCTIAPIRAGEAFSDKNIWVKRPGTGEIPATEFEAVLGRVAARDIDAGQQVKRSDLVG